MYRSLAKLRFKTSGDVRLRFAAHQSRPIRNPATLPVCGSGESKSNRDEGEQQRHKWSASFESKMFGSFAFCVLSYFATTHWSKQHAKKKIQLQLINRQIEELYEPLYKNRLVQRSSVAGALGEYETMKHFLQKAEQDQNIDMIKKWKTFVWNVLYPIDKEAQQILCKNAHLVVHEEFEKEFKLFLVRFARLQGMVEEWKLNEDKELPRQSDDATENEILKLSDTSGYLCKMLDRVEERCRELRKKQSDLLLDIAIENDHHFVIDILKKFF